MPISHGLDARGSAASSYFLSQFFGASVATAGPAVRSARRTARRITYYYSLPAGCVTRIVGGVRYSYCRGVYYQQVVDDAGVTAYIVVNP